MSTRVILAFAAILAGLTATRLCHVNIVWVEEAYPAAAAIQSAEYGKTVYRDVWFDKPIGAVWFYRLIGSRTGAPLRIAGALYSFACCVAIFLFGRAIWGETEGLLAAAALAWSLTFDEPSAVLAFAPDLGMVLPQIVAMYFAWRREWYVAGPLIALGFWMNVKMIFAGPASLLACAGRGWFGLLWLALLATGLIAASSVEDLEAYMTQVWEWGRAYSADTFVEHPLREGIVQTGEWIFFHLALVVGAVLYLTRGESRPQWKVWMAWIGASLVAVCLGLRFAPRYYLQLLPVFCLLGAAGFARAPRAMRIAMLAAMLIPAVRFGPRYAQLAADLVAGREHAWNALALHRDSREVARILLESNLNPPSENPTLFVWGYRPDIWMLSRLPAATRFLDSQPINGVFADRHLKSSRPSIAGDRLAEAAANLAEAARARPARIVDGLGPLNPELALERSPLWRDWGPSYEVLARTKASIVYRLRAVERLQ